MTVGFVMMNHVNAIAMMAQNLEGETVKGNIAKSQSQKSTFVVHDEYLHQITLSLRRCLT